MDPTAYAAPSRTPSPPAAPAASMYPPLIVREGDERRLYEIAIGAMLRAPRLAGGLLDELSRATVLPDDRTPGDVVGLGSTVSYRETGGPDARRRTVRIVGRKRPTPRRGVSPSSPTWGPP